MNEVVASEGLVDLPIPVRPLEPSVLAARVEALIAEGDAPLGVAYSGGVDSSVLLALAVRALGVDQVVAFMAVSELLPQREYELAIAQALDLGVQVVELVTSELEDPNFVRNDVNRCYACKAGMFAQVDVSVAREYGLRALAFGENADDRGRVDRPGARAADEAGVLRPLADAGLRKADVRAVARWLGLPSADKPAAPCLASRIPHGEEVTSSKLAAIEALEDALWAVGVSDCRVRHHGDVARIEVPVRDFALFAGEGADGAQARAVIMEAAHQAGFKHAVLDLAGLQSGAFTMNALGT
ncbi:MAG: ATP-dependent sacrificial sulfur transferase LarE [Actinomycetaceae bacterium]|nr:ATP-dependent sacrificial sulfur transferase LarE [Actinomycetaceae bacterium]